VCAHVRVSDTTERYGGGINELEMLGNGSFQALNSLGLLLEIVMEIIDEHRSIFFLVTSPNIENLHTISHT